MKRLYLLFFAAMFFLPLQACALSGSAIEGQVLEEGTNKPIPEAIIIARWSGHLATFAHGKTVCYHALSTTTDENGVYHLPAWKKKITEDWQKNVRPETVIVTAHKPGYEEYRPPGYARSEEFKQNIRYLQPFAGGREERLRKVAGAAVSCGSAGDSKKNLLPLYRKLYADALPLAVTKNDRLIVNGLLRQIDLIELPYEEVLKRADERNKALQKEFPNE